MTELSSNALEVCNKRYFEEGEGWEDRTRVVGKAVAAYETEKEKYSELFAEEIYDLNFIPGGRTLRNSGKQKQCLLNCGTFPLEDSIESIGDALKNSMILWSYGAGLGSDFSTLRPKGAPLTSKGGNSSGLVSFLHVFDSAGSILETGGQRRSGFLGMCRVDHPEIYEFIDAKTIDKTLTCCNLSVAITNEFIKAVEEDRDWNLHFSGKVYRTVKARELWNKILSSALECGEPGIINYDNLVKNNSYYFQPILTTNLCCSGDTKVAVADGRGEVTFKQLSEEDKDIPVFCTNDSGDIVVRTMRHPRKTGEKQKLYKVTFDDGSTFKCTYDHKIKLLNGEEAPIATLKIGDRISHLTKYQLTNTRAKSRTPYWFWNRGAAFQKSEHRIMYEQYNGAIKPNHIIHHKDFDSLNNDKDNLLSMHKNDHSKLHSAISTVGAKNGRYKGVTPEEYFELIKKYTVELGKKISCKEWHTICKENNYPISKYICGEYKSVFPLLTKAAKDLGLSIKRDRLWEFKKFEELKKTTDLDIFFKNGIFVNRKCEHCGNNFVVQWNLRQQSFCNKLCVGRSIKRKESNRKYWEQRQSKVKESQIKIFNELTEELSYVPLKKEWEKRCKENKIPHRLVGGKPGETTFCFKAYSHLKEAALATNFKVSKIEYIGEEDVYNGTVDDTHNYLVVVGDTPTKKKLINSMNCGELPLPAYGMCCLGSLVLPSFISGKSTNWKKLENSIKLAVRFLDNVIDVNHYAIRQTDIATKESRRIGLGAMGLHDYLIKKEVRYGSEKSLIEIERLYRFIRDVAYIQSTELAKEKGTFPKFSANDFCRASFVRKLPVKLKMKIRRDGIRNCCILTSPPTGSTSLIPEVSSGIEPIYALACMRDDRISKRFYLHKELIPYLSDDSIKEYSDLPEYITDSFSLTPSDHLEIQSLIQSLTDNATSKTVNVPEDFDDKELTTILLEYISSIKGVTLYKDKSKEGQILRRLSLKEAKEIHKQNIESEMIEEDVQCASGQCDL